MKPIKLMEHIIAITMIGKNKTIFLCEYLFEINKIPINKDSQIMPSGMLLICHINGTFK